MLSGRSRTRGTVWPGLSALLLCASVLAGSADVNAGPLPLVNTGPLPLVDAEMLEARLQQGEVRLDARGFVHLALLRNPEVLLTTEQKRIAAFQLEHDRAAYMPELFSTFSAADNEIQNNPEAENLTTIDRNTRFEIGLRTLLPTGAEITLDYRTDKRFNNTLSVNDPEGINDRIGTLGITVRQPLLRGLGAPAIAGRIEQSERGLEIRRQEIRQKLLGTSYEALTLYWQLNRAERLIELTNASLGLAHELASDTEALVRAGRLPESVLLEARSTILLREAEVLSARNTRDQVEASVKSLLNLSSAEQDNVRFSTVAPEAPSAWQRPPDLASYVEAVLVDWPNQLIAQQRVAIETVGADMARNDALPQLDVVAGYVQNSRRFDKSFGGTARDSLSSRYPGWNVGLEYSMPLDNSAARAKEKIARARLAQAQVEADTVEVDFANQLWSRIEQVELALNELALHESNSAMLRDLLKIEQQRFDQGAARFSDVVDRQDGMNSGIVREVNARMRYELARAALRLSDGSLLRELGVEFEMEL